MQTQGTDPTTPRPIDQVVALPRILTTWAELIEDQRKDRNSSFAIHARAAAARLETLERLARAAARFIEQAPASGQDADAMNSLRSALAACEVSGGSQGANRAVSDQSTH